MSALERQERIIKNWWAHTLSCMLDFLIELNGRVLSGYALCFVDADLLNKDFVSLYDFNEMMNSLGLPEYAGRVSVRFLIYIDDNGVKILVTGEAPSAFGSRGDMLYYEKVFSESNAGVLYGWSGSEFIRTGFNDIHSILRELLAYTAKSVAPWRVDLSSVTLEYETMLQELCDALSERLCEEIVHMR